MNNVYPRPQLQRDSFFSLDGAWELNLYSDADVALPGLRLELRGEIDEVQHFLVRERGHAHKGTSFEFRHPV